MTDRLDKWEEERHERLNSVQASPQSSDHNNVQASLEPPSELISFPFQLESSSSFQSANCPHFHNHFQEEAQLSQRFNPQPSTDVIDVTKLARQDQPPPAYENVDERLPNNASRPSPLTTRASRPLPMPPLDRHNSSTSIHSMANAAADSPTPESHESSSPTTQSYSTPLSSAPSCTNTVLPPGRSFSAHGGLG
ncbi:hypothetical protein B0F90DRAFT_1093834 [Multifurca ochricompacta]|uniref:Uncharacterized protein n=1 Tax=Multifurca ochricompacta TaxID=376703 RepID=A0AAD4M9V9_9AGAM|nr:hypothetical protein B0F90DRAFT_1093834 [Multifurca ochricompacta]